MKHQPSITAILSAAALAMVGCDTKDANIAAGGGGTSTGTAGGNPLEIVYPPAVVSGTEKAVTGVPNLIQVPEAPRTFRVPAGTTLLSKQKKVTSSDDNPIIGSLDVITDGDRQCGEGYYVELLDGTQWVQLDLEKSAAIHAVCVWHNFMGAKPPAFGRAYHDVIIQISDDPTFKTGFTTIYNNDYDDSSKLGNGKDSPYAESRFGLIADGNGTVGRYVRLYSAGNTANEMNHYTEVEVYGIAK
jgi:hypothetical protein